MARQAGRGKVIVPLLENSFFNPLEVSNELRGPDWHRNAYSRWNGVSQIILGGFGNKLS
jgi:hypothetical protein